MSYDEFAKRLDEIGLSRSAFAELTSMSQASIYNWSNANRPIPGWVESWLECYEKSKVLDSIVESIDNVYRKDRSD